MPPKTRTMAGNILQKLEEQWVKMAPTFEMAKKAFFAAKDHDDNYTEFREEELEDEAATEVEHYGLNGDNNLCCLCCVRKSFPPISLSRLELSRRDSPTQMRLTTAPLF